MNIFRLRPLRRVASRLSSAPAAWQAGALGALLALTAVPAVASRAPTRWLMLLKRSPGYMVYLPDGYRCMEG